MSIVVNHWRMDSSLNALIHCETGETRRLGEYHFILLETLAKNADAVLSRSFLMTEVWKNRIVGGNSLPTAIHALRVAIDDDGKQQEIIKTIPKKGYLFNKNYLIENINHNVNEVNDNGSEATVEDTLLCECAAEDRCQDVSPVLTEQVSFASPDKPVHVAIKAPILVKKHPWRSALIILSVIAIALFLFTFMYYFNAPSSSQESDTPQLVKEELNNASRITVYHLYDPDVKRMATTPFSQHILPGIQGINQLLDTHNVTMNLYYRVSLNKFALDIVLNNQCNDSWQLALNFERWQNKDNEMNNVMYKEVEKVLNEMPKCK